MLEEANISALISSASQTRPVELFTTRCSLKRPASSENRTRSDQGRNTPVRLINTGIYRINIQTNILRKHAGCVNMATKNSNFEKIQIYIYIYIDVLLEEYLSGLGCVGQQ